MYFLRQSNFFDILMMIPLRYWNFRCQIAKKDQFQKSKKSHFDRNFCEGQKFLPKFYMEKTYDIAWRFLKIWAKSDAWFGRYRNFECGRFLFNLTVTDNRGLLDLEESFENRVFRDWIFFWYFSLRLFPLWQCFAWQFRVKIWGGEVS